MKRKKKSTMRSVTLDAAIDAVATMRSTAIDIVAQQCGPRLPRDIAVQMAEQFCAESDRLIRWLKEPRP